MIILTETQRDGDWLKARTGLATASHFKDILAKTKSGPAAARRNYMVQLATERMTKQAASTFVNAAMTWGTEQEAPAKIVYANQMDVEIDEIGFCRHDTLQAGASPDGLIDWDGLIEVKCPYQSAVHIETWLFGMPNEHVAQIQGQLWITGRQWCDFVSYDPRMPEDLQLFVQRVERDEAYIDDLRHQVAVFLDEVDGLVSTLMGKTRRNLEQVA